jgi:hypothetical protein
METTRLLRSYALKTETINMLKKISKCQDRSMTNVIEVLIKQEAKRLGVSD